MYEIHATWAPSLGKFKVWYTADKLRSPSYYLPSCPDRAHLDKVPMISPSGWTTHRLEGGRIERA